MTRYAKRHGNDPCLFINVFSRRVLSTSLLNTCHLLKCITAHTAMLFSFGVALLFATTPCPFKKPAAFFFCIEGRAFLAELKAAVHDIPAVFSDFSEFKLSYNFV